MDTKTKKPPTESDKNDLREFACAALSGLLANPSTAITLGLEGVPDERRTASICEQAFSIGKTMCEVERS